MLWLRARLLGSDTLEPDAAIYQIEHWLSLFQERAELPISGNVSNQDDTPPRIERLYFDGPAANDWTAFAWHGDTLVPALSASLIFVPA